MDGGERNGPCPVCGGPGGSVFVRHGEHVLLRCSACGCAYLSPLPDPEQAAETNNDAYEGASTGYFAKVDKKMRRSRRRLRWLRRLAGGRLLDVGCNGGFLVEAAREAGFDAWGVDLDPVSIDYARHHYPGNNFLYGRIEDLLPRLGQFDVIHCSEVIEHVPDPRSFAAALAALARPGGWLYVTSPDFGHWRRPANLARWDAFTPPGHCIYFTAAGLRILMERSGFRLVRQRKTLKPAVKMLFRRAEG